MLLVISFLLLIKIKATNKKMAEWLGLNHDVKAFEVSLLIIDTKDEEAHLNIEDFETEKSLIFENLKFVFLQAIPKRLKD